MTSLGWRGTALAVPCSNANFAVGIAASSAESAASAINGNNQSEIAGDMLGKFLLGLGLVLTAAGATCLFMRRWVRRRSQRLMRRQSGIPFIAFAR